MPARFDKLFRLPRQRLAFLPTPLTELRRLPRVLGGPRLWIKRDDQTGLAFGGNKARKLEYLVGDALAHGADTLVTGGAAQSNHCRQTAAAAAACGMACHLALGGSAPPQANGNLLLDRLLGAQIHWCGARRKGEDIPGIVEWLKAEGKTPYVVPYGGSSPVGVFGYVDALREACTQLDEAGEVITHMLFASSSGATHAGLALGQRIEQRDFKVIGIRVEADQPGELPLEHVVTSLANEAGALVNIGERLDVVDVHLRSDWARAGYGVIGDAEREAIALMAQHEGILLDPVYTGRAMAGLIGLIRNGDLTARDNVLFWHTGGGPGLFAYAGALA